MNGEGKVLLVQERRGPAAAASRPDFWKLPTGLVEQGEAVPDAARREVFEETGVRTEFVSILGIRHGHNAPFGKSDMFFLCALRIADGEKTAPIAVQRRSSPPPSGAPRRTRSSRRTSRRGRTWTTCTGCAGYTPRASTRAWGGRHCLRGSAGPGRWSRTATPRRKRSGRRRAGSSAVETFFRRFRFIHDIHLFVRCRTRERSICQLSITDSASFSSLHNGPRPSGVARPRCPRGGRAGILPRSRRNPPCWSRHRWARRPCPSTCRSTPSPCRGTW